MPDYGFGFQVIVRKNFPGVASLLESGHYVGIGLGRELTALEGYLTVQEACRRTRLGGLTGPVLCWDVQEEERLADAGASQDYDDDNLFAPTKVRCFID